MTPDADDEHLAAGGAPGASRWNAAAMRYDSEGRWLGFDVVTDPDQLAEYRLLRDLALHHARSLQRYLAALRMTPIDPLVLLSTQPGGVDSQ